MEISAATATAGSSLPAKPVLLRPHASSPHVTSSTTTTIGRRASASATATVRRRARTRPRTRPSKTVSGAGDSFSGDDGDGPFGPGSGGSGGGGWNHGFGSGSGQGWDSSEPDVRRSAAEVALAVVYELMCLVALSNCTQFAVGGSRGFSPLASPRCASSPGSAEVGIGIRSDGSVSYCPDSPGV